MTDRWIGKVKPDPRWREENPYLNRASRPEPEQAPRPTAEEGETTISEIGPSFFTLKNIRCIDSDGNVMESYAKLIVNRFVEYVDMRVCDEKIILSPSRAEEHLEQQGQFLPSMALMCNILAVLYRNRDGGWNKDDIDSFLRQYGNSPVESGSYVHNTVIDWNGNDIIHYPNRSDYADPMLQQEINVGRRKTLSIRNPNSIKGVTMPLENALKLPHLRRYLQDLTGLPNPDIMAEIGDHLCGKSQFIIGTGGKKAAMIGGGLESFFWLETLSTPEAEGLVRGVRA